MRNNYQYKVAILFYMVIVLQVQPEFSKDHHYWPYYKHPHDHNHAHHLKHQMEHNHEHHHKHPHEHDHDHHRRSTIRKASRIYNGVPAPPGQGKFMAIMVNLSSPVLNHCSAVIITENMLLTAAHCLYNRSNAQLAMMRILPNAIPIPIYRYNRYFNHPWVKIITICWIHPRYNPNTTDIVYDIAIIRIGPEPWPLGEHIQPALMPVRVTHFDWRVVKGYGYGLETGPRIANYLNELNFRKSCEMNIFRTRVNNYPNVLFWCSNWAPGQNQNSSLYSNAGYGDSGGGLFILGSVERLDRSTNRIIEKTGLILAGIISMGSNYTIAMSDLRRPYGVWIVNVTTMLPWINSIVGVDFATYPFPMPISRRIG